MLEDVYESLVEIERLLSPDIRLIEVSDNEIVFYFRSSEEPFVETEFVVGSVTREAFQYAKRLPSGSFEFHLI